ncbi:MAG: manganese-binding transcriptional regulator MntR [Fimbriimonadaceae bacterium]|nr:manganese-binding transcriptional regulator MntR [Chthonomonadaceae bacterium]MCO5296975.1 manganese-binding transcriptional regulator MntR [Fimbriimonadaceae bacterium]
MARTTTLNGFARARAAHAKETAEDYLEMVEELREEQGEARAVDLARAMEVSHTTATKVLARLEREGLVTSRPYRGVVPTEAGRKIAEESRERHEVVVAFLKRLGVPDAEAEADAEGIEHHVGQATLLAIRRFLTG